MFVRSKSKIYGVVCGLLTALFLAWGVFGLRYSYVRAGYGLRDMGTSIGFYFTELFYFSGLVFPTVTTVPDTAPSVLPETYDGFQTKFTHFMKLLIDKENLRGYFGSAAHVLKAVFMFVMIFLPVVVLLVIVLRMALRRKNNKYNADTKPLRLFKRSAKYTYIPVKNWFAGLIAFLRKHTGIVKLWVFIALLNFNILTIVLEFIAYLFYISASFNFNSFYIQIYKLFMDLGVMFGAVPAWVWVIAGYVLFLWLRRRIAYARLRHMEMRDRGYINALPVVSMVVGTMGKKKTTMLTDMALSQEVMFRDRAFEKLLENDLKFPYFPWVNLENEMRRAMCFHQIYNLATCRQFIKKKCGRFDSDIKHCRRKCFDYDYNRYGMVYDDKLRVFGLWEVLEVYAQLYFIYVIQSSLLMSNYSIRIDNIIEDIGNFPLWNSDFFKRDSRLLDSFSRHAHILDFDALRLGRKVIEDNINANAFEFGVVVITESGKERGNMLDNQILKKDAAETNRKNDLFNMWLKMARHSATVDNYPFIKVIMDEQRPESMGADVRELCDIVHIRESGETRLALPFFFLENLLYDFLFSRFERFYYDHRYNRGDNTLTLWAVKKLFAAFHAYYSRTYNLFSFCVLKTEKERGTQDGQYDEQKYFLMSKKIYSRRFATDAFSDYFTIKALRSPIGLADLERYITERANLTELKNQNSYFINELQEHFK